MKNQHGYTYSCFRHVIPRPQHRLEKEHVHAALGDNNILDLDGDLAGGREDVNAFVGVFRVLIDWLVFLEPCICDMGSGFPIPDLRIANR